MLERYPLFDNSERLVIDRAFIDQVALPMGDRYEDGLFEHYFGDYAGMARKYAPRRILEIGVRYGYIAMCLCYGARQARPGEAILYRGMDDELYHGGSCAKANENFGKVIPWADAQAVKWNSFDEWINWGGFDIIHIDGNHDYVGVWNDINKAWPILHANGIIMLDDATTPGIRAAIDNFLSKFERSPEHVRVHDQPNERQHIYIQKVG